MKNDITDPEAIGCAVVVYALIVTAVVTVVLAVAVFLLTPHLPWR